MFFLKNSLVFSDFASAGTTLVTVVGAGGKSSFIFWLASQLKQAGMRVLVTTTTKMYIPKSSQCDYIHMADNNGQFVSQAKSTQPYASIHYYAKSCCTESNKASGLSISQVDEIKQSAGFDVIIVEADGSHHLPLKAPAEHEPCIPQSSDLVLAVSSAESILTPANPDMIQRWELFSAISGCSAGETIGFAVLDRLIKHPQGLFKNTPDCATRIWLINKIDLAISVYGLIELAQKLLANNLALSSVLLTDMRSASYPLKFCIPPPIANKTC